MRFFSQDRKNILPLSDHDGEDGELFTVMIDDCNKMMMWVFVRAYHSNIKSHSLIICYFQSLEQEQHQLPSSETVQ